MHRIVLHTAGIRPRVVTRTCPGSATYDAREGIDIRRSGRQRGGPVSNLLLNARALREAAAFRPELVVSGHIVTSPAARAIRRALGAPVVQYLHADEVRGRPRLARFAVRRADAIVAVSEHTAAIARAVGAPPERIHVIPNGVDLPQSTGVDLPHPGGPERASRPTLVIVARLVSDYKGHDVVIRALPLIRARVPDVEWLVVGEGPLRPQLEQQAAEAGVQDCVRFLGAVPDAERDAALRRAHVFVMPSRLPAGGLGGEGFGIVYLEAAAHALPVVAGNVGGAVDAVVDGQTGLLVDPTDHRAVAEACAALLLDRERAAALGRAGAERARQFAWPLIAARTGSLLLGLAGSGRGR